MFPLPHTLRANHVRPPSLAAENLYISFGSPTPGRNFWLFIAVVLVLLMAAETVVAGPLRYLFGGERVQPQWPDQGSPQPGPYSTPYGAGPGIESNNTPTYPLTNKHYGPRKFPPLMTGGSRPEIPPSAPGLIAFSNKEIAGTVIIVNRTCKLYLTVSQTEAFEYPISIGRLGFNWTGNEKISRIVDWPDWVPPAEMLKRQPELPLKMTGGLNNPLGVKALYLGDSLYRIHGTNDARSIGRAASSGCFRMLNEHVMHLSSLVQVGTPVKVVKSWSSISATHDLRAAELACSVVIPTSRR